MAILKILDGNAFRLRITGLSNSSAVNMNVISDAVVNFVRRGRLPQVYGVDSDGRLVVENEGVLACGIYSIEISGYYNGKPWRHHMKDAFKIVSDSEEADDPTSADDVPVYDLSTEVSFAGDGATVSYVNAQIAEHNADESAHPYLLERIENAGQVDDVQIDGQTIVDENKVANIDSSQFGKVDDIQVNGETIVSGKVANIQVTAETDGNVGTPEVEVEVVGGVINFAFDGIKGQPAEMTIGSTTTGEPNTAAQVTNSGTANQPILDFVIPKGEKGEQGEPGDSVIVGEGDLPLANVVSNATDKAITPKAVQDTIFTTAWAEQQIENGKYWNTTGCAVGNSFDGNSTNSASFYRIAKLDVDGGETLKFYGIVNNTKAVKTYVITDANDLVVEISSLNTGDDYTSTPLEITIPANGAHIYINLVNYSEGQKVTRYIVTNRLATAESNIANLEQQIESIEPTTLYPSTGQNTDGAMTQKAVTDAISAVETDVEAVASELSGTITEEQTIEENAYWNTTDYAVGDEFDGNSKTLSGWYRIAKLDVNEGDVFRFYGKAQTSNAAKAYIVTNANNKIVTISSLTNGSDYTTTPHEFTIAEGGAYLYVNLNRYESGHKLVKVVTEEFNLAEYVQMQEDVASMQSDITNLQEAVEGITTDLPLVGKTIVVFGDSISEFKLSTDKTYSEYLAEMSGATVINCAIGGSQLRQRTTPAENPAGHTTAYASFDIVNMVEAACTQNFTYQRNAATYEVSIGNADKSAIVERLAAVDWSAVDMVIIMGGTNDWTVNQGNYGSSGYVTFDKNYSLGAINYMLRLLTYTYPNVDVHFFGPLIRYIDENFIGAFKDSRAYETGDRVLCNHRLYEFTADRGAGAWTGEDATMLTVEQLYAISSDVVLNEGKTEREANDLFIAEAKLSHVNVHNIYDSVWNAYNFTTAIYSDLTHPRLGTEKLARKVYSCIMATRKV